MRHPMEEEMETQEVYTKKAEFGWLDVLAFTIAAYQVIFPFLFGLFGIVLVIYLILRLLAG